MTHAWRARTRAIAGGRPHGPDQPLNTPLIPATAFSPGERPGYSRVTNPTYEALEEVVASLEGADDGGALAFGSGMAAISAAFEVLSARAGKPCPVVAAPAVHYSGTRGLFRSLSRQGRIDLRPYDGADAAATAATVSGADVVLLESPANPVMTITDLRAAAAAAHAGGALVMCDNTYSTPLATRPLELGADIVVHSGSKYFAGHSDVIIGVAVAGTAELTTELRDERIRRGGIPGVLEAWLTTRGMRTLPVRFEAACANAGVIAERLADLAASGAGTSDILEVGYPGLASDPGHEVAARQMDLFGAVVTFRPSGGPERAEAIPEATRLWRHATSIGGVESTLERRARHFDESTETPADMVRLSVGCEDPDDLWDDLVAALDATRPAG